MSLTSYRAAPPRVASRRNTGKIFAVAGFEIEEEACVCNLLIFAGLATTYSPVS